jgi:pantoate--beta-alanine ligase
MSSAGSLSCHLVNGTLLAIAQVTARSDRFLLLWYRDGSHRAAVERLDGSPVTRANGSLMRHWLAPGGAPGPSARQRVGSRIEFRAPRWCSLSVVPANRARSTVNALTAQARPLLAIETVAEIRLAVARARAMGLRVGFVPTMGALHAGHASLLHAARRECGFVVASIFVNPKQFGPHEDYERYPRNLDRDLGACEAAGVDAVFCPRVETVYPVGFVTTVNVGGLADLFEGACRPGHFQGVATVVLKLFQMVPADVAYFGQKDYQQQALIKRMVVDLNLPIEIRVCPTVREQDGLALSSRNVYLNAEQRRSALALSASLALAREELARGQRDLRFIGRQMRALLQNTPQVVPDYATIVDPESLEELASPLPRVVALVAARVGATRLIDNELIEVPPT